jgi:hypothetical protein
MRAGCKPARIMRFSAAEPGGHAAVKTSSKHLAAPDLAGISTSLDI